MTSANLEIFFVLVASIKGVIFNPGKPEGLQFDVNMPETIRIKLKPVNPEEDQFGHRLGLEARVKISVSATTDQYQFVHNLNDSKFVPFGPKTTDLPRVVNGEVKIDSNGHLLEGYGLPFSIYPLEARVLCDQARTRLSSELLRFLGLLRWRQNMQAEHGLIDHATLYWGGTSKLHYVPTLSNVRTIPARTGIQWTETDATELRRLWMIPETVEPLAHELLREAGSVARSSPRSGILIAVAALEAGVKAHCSAVAPDSLWLLEVGPSPPIFKMLRDYLPSIHKSRGTDVSFWEKFKPTIKKLDEFISIRNKLSHTGVLPAGAIEPFAYFDMISDVLYGLDVLCGHEWAKERISKKIRHELAWPNPAQEEVLIEILLGE